MGRWHPCHTFATYTKKSDYFKKAGHAVCMSLAQNHFLVPALVWWCSRLLRQGFSTVLSCLRCPNPAALSWPPALWILSVSLWQRVSPARWWVSGSGGQTEKIWQGVNCVYTWNTTTHLFSACNGSQGAETAWTANEKTNMTSISKLINPLWPLSDLWLKLFFQLMFMVSLWLPLSPTPYSEKN